MTMIDVIYQIFFIFVSAFEVYMFYIFHNEMLQTGNKTAEHRIQKVSGRLLLLGILLTVILTMNFISQWFENYKYNIVVLPVLYIVAGLILYKGQIQKSILTTLIFYMILAGTEFFVDAISVFLIGQSPMAGGFPMAAVLSIIAAVKALSFVIYKLLGRLKTISEPYQMPMPIFFCFLLLPIISIMIFVLLFDITAEIELNLLDTVLYIASCMLLLASSGLIFYIYHAQLKMLRNEHTYTVMQVKYETEFAHYKTLAQAHDKNMALHHDLENNFQVIHTLIDNLSEEGPGGEIRNGVCSILRGMSNKISEVKQTRFCDHAMLNGLLSIKQNEASAHEIQFEVFIHKCVNFSFLSEYDLCTMVSNLLDNAIEAAVLNPGPKWVRFSAIPVAGNEESALYLIVENTYNGCLVTQNGKLISSKKDKSTHGYGVKNINEVAQRYGGEYHYEEDCQTQMFKATLLLSK